MDLAGYVINAELVEGRSVKEVVHANDGRFGGSGQVGRILMIYPVLRHGWLVLPSNQ